MQEQRLTSRLMKHWDSSRKTEPIPDIARFHTAPIEDIWPLCIRLKVDSRTKTPIYNYEYMGKPIADLYGRDLTGLIVDQTTKHFPGKVIHFKFDQVLQGKAPLQDEGHFINENGKMIKYRACILPFGNADKGVTHIIVGLSCRAF